MVDHCNRRTGAQYLAVGNLKHHSFQAPQEDGRPISRKSHVILDRQKDYGSWVDWKEAVGFGVVSVGFRPRCDLSQ
ncbi:hypothetical protein T12_7879 [Trichinella patagoniensis]|uniref:Uncharacterized protein n=1 Tax=Trichinella patagoniensis TaxID=990121 RepID=A0A0V1A560_9BILA|nr:hypothetical protein T12_7879 [Trichinella patagoniensis]